MGFQVPPLEGGFAVNKATIQRMRFVCLWFCIFRAGGGAAERPLLSSLSRREDDNRITAKTEGADDSIDGRKEAFERAQLNKWYS